VILSSAMISIKQNYFSRCESQIFPRKRNPIALSSPGANLPRQKLGSKESTLKPLTPFESPVPWSPLTKASSHRHLNCRITGIGENHPHQPTNSPTPQKIALTPLNAVTATGSTPQDRTIDSAIHPLQRRYRSRQ